MHMMQISMTQMMREVMKMKKVKTVVKVKV